jgi:hypothetical protein
MRCSHGPRSIMVDVDDDVIRYEMFSVCLKKSSSANSEKGFLSGKGEGQISQHSF